MATIKTTTKPGGSSNSAAGNLCAAGASLCANPNPALRPTDLRVDALHRPGYQYCSYCVRKGIDKRLRIINGGTTPLPHPTPAEIEAAPWQAGEPTIPPPLDDKKEKEEQRIKEKRELIDKIMEIDESPFNISSNEPDPILMAGLREVGQAQDPTPPKPREETKTKPIEILKTAPKIQSAPSVHPIRPSVKIEPPKSTPKPTPRSQLKAKKEFFIKKPSPFRAITSRVAASTGEIANGLLGIGGAVVSLGAAGASVVAGTGLFVYGFVLGAAEMVVSTIPLRATKALARLTLGKLSSASFDMAKRMFTSALPKAFAGTLRDGRIVPLAGMGVATAGAFVGGLTTFGAIGAGMVVVGTGAFVALPAYGFARGLITGNVRSPIPQTAQASIPGANYTILQKTQSFVARIFGQDTKSKLYGSLKMAYQNPKWTRTRDDGLDGKAIHDLNNEFERVTADALVALGLKDVKVNGTQAAKENGHVDANGRKRAGDGGYDVIARDKEGRIVLVSCKRYKNPVGVEEVRQIYATGTDGNMARFKGSRQILVTTKGFTKEAQIFARGNGVILTTLDQIIEEAAKN